MVSGPLIPALEQSSLGEYHKAIRYYEQALATLISFRGQNHTRTNTVRNHLKHARAKLAELDTLE